MKIDEVCTLRELFDATSELVERVQEKGSFDGADRKRMVALSK